jgi:DNA-binding SARP family transcriptional activator
MILALTARQPYHAELPTWAERGLELSRVIDDPILRVRLKIYLACYYYWRGDFTRVAASIDSFRHIGRSKEIPIVDRLLATFFIGRYEWLMVSPAVGIATITGALELAETTGAHVLDRQMFVECAVAALTNGDSAMAERYLHKISPTLDKLARCDRTSYHYVSALNCLATGNLPLAYSHQEEGLELAIGTGMPLFEAICRLLSAQVLHERGEYKTAQEHVARSLKLAREGKARFVEYMGLLGEAQFDFEGGKEQKGRNALSKALALGREYGYVNTITWRPGVMARLCAKALEAGIEVEYVQQLIRKRGLIAEKPPLELEQWPWAVKIFTLGRFGFLKDGQPIKFTGKAQRKPLELLKALIALGGREVSEEQLTEALWPDAEGDAARQALSTTLHRLRHLIGHEKAIHRHEGKLTLDSRHCWVDLWAFQRLLARAETATSSAMRDGRAWGEASQWTDRALYLYRGPFLGDHDVSWAAAVTDRLRRRLIRQLGELGKHWEAQRDWPKAIGCYEKALEAEPRAEEFYRRLMAFYSLLGRRAEGLEVYQRCCRALDATMGVVPSPETEAIHSSLRST